MKFTKRLSFIAATVALSLSSVVTSAQETLNLVSPAPPRAHLNQEIFPKWVDAVNEAANGSINVELRTGGQLANARNMHERVLADVAQIGWVVLAQSSANFEQSSVAELPFLIPDAETGSVAMWRLYEKGFLDRDMEGLKPLAIITFAQSTLHANKPIKTLTDIDGNKISVNGKYAAEMLQSLGAAPISIPLPGQYQALSKGTVDGTMMVWSAFMPFKLFEVTTHHFDAPLGTAVAMVYMTEEKFNSLPAEAQEALMSQSGEAYSREFGAFWDRVAQEARAAVSKMPGHTINGASDEDIEVWRTDAQAIVDNWVSNVDGGTELLEALQAEVAAIQADSKSSD